MLGVFFEVTGGVASFVTCWNLVYRFLCSKRKRLSIKTWWCLKLIHRNGWYSTGDDYFIKGIVCTNLNRYVDDVVIKVRINNYEGKEIWSKCERVSLEDCIDDYEEWHLLCMNHNENSLFLQDCSYLIYNDEFDVVLPANLYEFRKKIFREGSLSKRGYSEWCKNIKRLLLISRVLSGDKKAWKRQKYLKYYGKEYIFYEDRILRYAPGWCKKLYFKLKRKCYKRLSKNEFDKRVRKMDGFSSDIVKDKEFRVSMKVFFGWWKYCKENNIK